MFKVLANKVLGFQNGEIDKKGLQVTVKTSIGFCELPDWVQETDYFKAACLDGSLKPFQNSSSSEEVLKANEKLQEINDQIKAAEEKRDLLNTANELAMKDSKKEDNAKTAKQIAKEAKEAGADINSTPNK